MGSISVKDRLGSIGFKGRLPTDAFPFPRSALVPAGLRWSVRFALSGTEVFGWPGIHEVHQGWSSETYHDDKWLEQHQGLVFNGKHWFCSQMGGTIRKCEDNTVDLPRIGATLATMSVPSVIQKKYTHLGEIDWARTEAFAGFVPALLKNSTGAEGLILAAMERDGSKYWCGTVLAFWDDMSGLCPEASSPLLYPSTCVDGPPEKPGMPLYAQTGCPWVALNPWDGLLYSARSNPYPGPNGGILLHVYDVNDRVPISKAVVQDPKLQDRFRIPEALFDALDTDGDGVIWVFNFVRAVELGASFKAIQGGCFSNDGCLYLLNDEHGEQGGVPDKHGVWRFSMLTGALLDVIGVDRESSKEQECEGVCLYGNKAAYAVQQLAVGETYVCATVWDWEPGDPDIVGPDIVGPDIVWLKRLKLGKFVP